MRVMLEAKLPFAELGRRWAAAGSLRDPKHVFMLLDEELDAFAADPTGWDRHARAARGRPRRARPPIPPYIVQRGEPVPPISTWKRRSDTGDAAQVGAGEELTGIGVSPGVGRGRARVVFDLSEIADIEPGDIIVCSTTDPSWVPLFLIAGGVVCDVGASGSHAAIVARELGVPCVVSVRDARLRVPDGAMLEIDGTAGNRPAGLRGRRPGQPRPPGGRRRSPLLPVAPRASKVPCHHGPSALPRAGTAPVRSTATAGRARARTGDCGDLTGRGPDRSPAARPAARAGNPRRGRADGGRRPHRAGRASPRRVERRGRGPPDGVVRREHRDVAPGAAAARAVAPGALAPAAAARTERRGVVLRRGAQPAR